MGTLGSLLLVVGSYSVGWLASASPINRWQWLIPWRTQETGVLAGTLIMEAITVLLILPALSPSGAWEYGIGGNAGDGTATAQSAGLLARLFSPQIKLITLGVLACTAGLIGLAGLISLLIPFPVDNILGPIAKF